MPHKLHQAITVIKAGDKKTGQQLLLEIIKNERHNEQAWLWLTDVVDNKDRKIDCLKQLLKINPNNEAAKRGLARLSPVNSPDVDDSASPTHNATHHPLNQNLTATDVEPVKLANRPRPHNYSHERQLERIAMALERIAHILEQRQPLTPVNRYQANHNHRPLLFEAILDILQGRNGEVVTNNEAVDETNDLDPIKNFLKRRNITIKTVPPEDPADHIINSLSLFLGERYDRLHKILARIKYHMQQGSCFTENIKDNSPQTISHITTFCKRLYDIGFLEQYKYHKSPQCLIKAKTTTLPMAQKFFSGQWLERFALQKVEEVINQVSREMRRPIHFSYLINPQIILPNGDNFEFDLIFQANNSFFWIESKSGEHRQHIVKYSEISNLLGLDERHSIIVLTDISQNEAKNILALHGMTIYTLDQLKEGLIETLQREFGSVLQ